MKNLQAVSLCVIEPAERDERFLRRFSPTGYGLTGATTCAVATTERFFSGRSRKPDARRRCLVPRRPTFTRSVWLFHGSWNHSCGTARDLHPFPPKDTQRSILPAHCGAYIEFSKKKIEAICSGTQTIFRPMVQPESLMPGEDYLHAKKVT